ncbi:MAG: DNA pilot protein [Microviridae sp.]|nr:MAG: DNA pilot protein [Microviridae sp.]
MGVGDITKPIIGAAKGSLFGGGILGGILGLGSSLLSNLGARRRQKYADQQNIKFWQMQNAYNTPAQQMARLKKAGLNPALIYGSGATNTGVAGSIAPSKPAPYNIKNPVPDMLQSAMIASQIELQDSQAGKNRAEEKRTLGLTPYEINSALSKADQEKQKAIIETVNANVATAQRQDKINELAEKVLILRAQKKLEQAKSTYKSGMYKLKVNPDTAIYNSVYQTIFGGTKDFFQNKVPDFITKHSGVNWNKSDYFN